MSRNLPWMPTHDTVDFDVQSPARKRVKREPLSDDLIASDSPPLGEVKHEAFKSSQPHMSITERDLFDGYGNMNECASKTRDRIADLKLFSSSTEQSKCKKRLKDEPSPDSKVLNRHTNPRGYAPGRITADDIERSTDGRTVMPKELQMKKNAEALAARQQAAFQPMDVKDEEKYESDDEDDVDLFAGTHFHQLITTKKSIWSLTGVFGIKIKSFTRAAAGFGPPAPLTLNRRRTAISQPHPLQEAKRSHESSGAVTESSDEDDLDGPAYRGPTSTRATESKVAEAKRETSRTQRTTSSKKDTQTDATRAVVEKWKPSPVQQSKKPTLGFKSRMQSLFDDLDELPEPSGLNTSIPDKKKGHSSASKTHEKSPAENNLGSKKFRSHNVPTFLL
ncbi:hypothetical protein N7481_008015 [Penicillium waksmanii]|uniref:uncharacterized protein n=1 Tax=Penicillium waksmanii TaxID=69791 RepID=UPI00254745BC|nr:uncharacterized protein N7481_008015 [Penicillium waksmanii]KAJ5980717.1 hypothetical protein N7481_008015 [Penicillium waksmanii]